MPGTLSALSHIIHTTFLWGEDHCYLHLQTRKWDQKGHLSSCSRSHIQAVWRWNLMSHTAPPLKSSLQSPLSYKGCLDHRLAKRPNLWALWVRASPHTQPQAASCSLLPCLHLCLWGSLNRLASASHAHLTLSISLPYFHIVSLSPHTHTQTCPYSLHTIRLKMSW